MKKEETSRQGREAQWVEGLYAILEDEATRARIIRVRPTNWAAGDRLVSNKDFVRARD